MDQKFTIEMVRLAEDGEHLRMTVSPWRRSSNSDLKLHLTSCMPWLYGRAHDIQPDQIPRSFPSSLVRR
jgi:hypothetical protein